MASVSMLLGEGIIKRGIPQRVMLSHGGMLTLVGEDASLRYAVAPWAAKGSFAVVGNIATLASVRAMPVANGNFVLTGKDADLVFVDNGPSVVTTNRLVDYDVDAYGLTDGANIAVWADGSGNNKALAGTVAHIPVNHTGGPNGLRYASFNGSQVAKSVATDCMPVGTAERILFVVFKCNNRTPSASNIACYGQIGSSGAHFSAGLQGGNDNVIGYFWSSNSSQHSVGDISQWHAVALQLTAAGHPRWWLDGTDGGFDSGVNPNTGSGIFAIGGRDGDDGDFTGNVARVIGHGALTDQQITDQFAYLRSIYGTP